MTVHVTVEQMRGLLQSDGYEAKLAGSFWGHLVSPGHTILGFIGINLESRRAVTLYLREHVLSGHTHFSTWEVVGESQFDGGPLQFGVYIDQMLTWAVQNPEDPITTMGDQRVWIDTEALLQDIVDHLAKPAGPDPDPWNDALIQVLEGIR